MSQSQAGVVSFNAVTRSGLPYPFSVHVSKFLGVERSFDGRVYVAVHDSPVVRTTEVTQSFREVMSKVLAELADDSPSSAT